LAFTPDGKRIAVTSCDNQIRFIDSASGETVLSVSRPECGSDPAFSQDGKVFGWFGGDGFYYIDLTGGEAK
jgi:WD40 repeat protein